MTREGTRNPRIASSSSTLQQLQQLLEVLELQIRGPRGKQDAAGGGGATAP